MGSLAALAMGIHRHSLRACRRGPGSSRQHYVIDRESRRGYTVGQLRRPSDTPVGLDVVAMTAVRAWHRLDRLIRASLDFRPSGQRILDQRAPGIGSPNQFGGTIHWAPSVGRPAAAIDDIPYSADRFGYPGRTRQTASPHRPGGRVGMAMRHGTWRSVPPAGRS